MSRPSLRDLLEAVARGEIDVDAAVSTLRTQPYEDLGFARVDHHRLLRRGRAESVYCPGKQVAEVVSVVSRLATTSPVVLATKASPEVFAAVKAACPDAVYHPRARMIVVGRSPDEQVRGRVLVMTAGTSDIDVAEEACVTLEAYGHEVRRLYDVGVAGVHRLIAELESLRWPQVVIVVAGMDGALPSVVGGLCSQPVVAVPTSVGYGASCGGLAALLTMLNSCTPGVAVVNIDNGYGAARFADALLRAVPVRAPGGAGAEMPEGEAQR